MVNYKNHDIMQMCNIMHLKLATGKKKSFIAKSVMSFPQPSV